MKTVEILKRAKAFHESATIDLLGMRLAKFERAESNEEMWEAFDRILLLLKEEVNFKVVNELENAEHRILPDAEETAEAAYKAGLLAGAAQAIVAVYELFPIPKKRRNGGGINVIHK